MTFLYRNRLFERWSDTRRKARVRMEEHVQAGRPSGRQIRQTERLRSDGELLETEVKGPALTCQEKLLVRTVAPVPKPTQVGRKRILRCAGKPSLRNSAKYIRNFGKRIAQSR